METILRVEINALCIILVAIISASIGRGSPGQGPDQAPDFRLFRLLLLSTALMLILDMTSWILDGKAGAAARVALYAVNSLYYAIHSAPTVLYILYADYEVYRDESRTARLGKPLAVFIITMVAVALSTPWTGLLFQISEKNYYLRGPAFPAYAVILFGLTLFSTAPLLIMRKKTSTRTFWTLLAYPLLCITAALIQDLFYGLVLIWPATTVFLITAALNMYRLRGDTDHLTGMANRRSLDEELARLIGSARVKGFSGILVDLDEFKSINDRFGHELGDQALEDAAEILKSAIRRDDFVARFGGDEFVLLLPGSNATALAEIVARIHALSEAHNTSSGRPYRLDFSVGAAVYDASLDPSARSFLARIDKAMYVDKMSRKRRAEGSA